MFLFLKKTRRWLILLSAEKTKFKCSYFAEKSTQVSDLDKHSHSEPHRELMTAADYLEIVYKCTRTWLVKKQKLQNKTKIKARKFMILKIQTRRF